MNSKRVIQVSYEGTGTGTPQKFTCMNTYYEVHCATFTGSGGMEWKKKTIAITSVFPSANDKPLHDRHRAYVLLYIIALFLTTL